MPSLFLIKFLACYSAKQSCVPNLILLDSVVAKINRGSQKFLDPSPPLTCIHFYRATCMHSADYAVARCLSVGLSHAGILSKRLNVPPKFFHHRIARPFQFFRTKQKGNTPTSTPLNSGVECKGVWKNHDFRLISPFISEMMQDRVTVTMEGE